MNGWTITNVSAAGITSSAATVITRNSPWMVVNAIVDGNSNKNSVQLPVADVMVGDLVEVCVGSTSNSFAYVWYGTTVMESSTTLFDEVGAGRCHLYRYVSGTRWNRYS